MKKTTKATYEVRVQRLNETPGGHRVDTPDAAYAYWCQTIMLMPWYDREREMCVSLALSTKYNVIGHTLVSIGTVNETIVHPRDVFRAAVALGAYAVLLIHNHPSGESSPSEADRRLTSRIAEAGRILQLQLLDHLIVGAATCFSFKEGGLL